MGLLHQWWAVMVLLLLQMRFYSSNSQHHTCHPRDQEALREFVAEFELYPPNVWRFNSSADCCEWWGVTCKSSSSLGLNDTNNTARVTKLELVNIITYGRLSESLGRLDQIRVLNLSGNSIYGSIPSSIFNMVNLETLDLSSNDLSGGIPKSLANSRNLILLNLGHNRLSGPLHLNCDVMTSLTSLDLRYNEFNSSLLEHLPSCKNLGNINLAGNFFNGQVPESFKDFHSLIHLSLSDSWLVNISSTLHILQQCKNLTTLDLSYNFRGEMLPDHPSLHFEKLKVLNVSNCGLVNISSTLHTLQQCKNLTTLDLSGNFQGEMLHDHPSLHFEKLKVLIVSNCGLVNISSTLHTLQQCKNLMTLDLSGNFLGEMLPDHPSLHFENLKVLIVAGCPLTGPIPSWLRKSANLQVLDLSRNSLAGPIPNWIGGFTNLFYLDLQSNLFTGEIPKSLTRLHSLSTIELSQNELSGPIWEEFGNLKKLHVFDLSDNILSGSIPESLNHLSRLSYFSVAYNNLSGRSPSGRLCETFPSSSFEGNHFSGDDSPQCQVDTPELDVKPRSKTSEEDYVLDFSYGVALGYGLALVIVSIITCSAFELHGN